VAELSAEYGRRPREIAPEALSALCAHSWPGNVRELRNVIERLVIMAPGERIEAADLPAPLGAVAAPGTPAPPPERSGRLADFPSLAAARDDFEKRYILQKYDECGGNMSRTAEALHVERSNLYRKMKAFGLLPARKAEA
jgi:two-component system nitrogen regulation response regulator NtrX